MFLNESYFSNDFAGRFNSVKSFENFPHITILRPFNFDENKEELLTEKFSGMNLKFNSFEVFLNGFGCFANSKNPVIFINPENTVELQQLYDEVQSNFEFHPYGKFHPHLTVAFKDLSPENFKKSWQEYQNKTFEDSFLVDKICLFKHENKKWNLLKIKFLN